ncbi:hypothetical protein [Paenibacillus flagellatus]|uniref:Uncharacterized protein n=1 Tax=Paenibacillus flagellatus TaxID=2211139 RepID=A0A2V5KEF6_9BACL|nr:hypothetical protein [Paenibacillus flagellatus]PYI57482.1 hypothetical protein DLM86_03350 [Paenibacillus flagellatus]
MKAIRIPAFLHDVFGERQTAGALAAVLLFGGAMTAASYGAYPGLVDGVAFWRGALALLLAFDIFAGCVANFTASTSNFYAERHTNRLVFIAVHIHLPLVAWLLNAGIGFAVGVWAYTIGGAFIVNGLIGRPSQRFVAGVLLSVGLGGMLLLPDVDPFLRTVGLFFMVKVMYAFAVDHYGRASAERIKGDERDVVSGGRARREG